MEEANNIILEGIHYSTRRVIHLGIRNGFIYSVTELDGASISETDRDRLPVIAPGLVDLQINGMAGVDFNDPALLPDQVEAVLALVLKEGVTRFYPTLLTGPVERISYLIGIFTDLKRANGLAASMLGGIHLEGPFISKKDGPRGAHPAEYCLNPDITRVQEWQEEAEGLIHIISLAPELPGSEQLIKTCVEMGMVVAIGHTAADTDQIKRAVDAGASLSTHLGNGCHPVLPRHPNYIWDQLASDELSISMIADGFHLPDSVLKVFSQLKKDRCILVSDGMSYTGMKPGKYNSPSLGKICLTEDAKLHREGNPDLLAGSASTLLQGIRKMSKIGDMTQAWQLGSVNPLNLMKPGSGNGLQVGMPADLVLLETGPEISISKVYKNGILRVG